MGTCAAMLARVLCFLGGVWGEKRRPSAVAALSRREVADAVNAVDALSSLLTKSLKEDGTGQCHHFISCGLCSLLHLSAAISAHLRTLAGLSASASQRRKLDRSTRWRSDFSCGEIQLLLLAVEESVVRIIRINSDAVKTMSSSVSSQLLDDGALATELQRIATM
jgi:hypothetical protein